MASADPYAVLGVSRMATATEIKSAYRRLAQERHPDKPDGSHEAFVELSSAYEFVLARCGQQERPRARTGGAGRHSSGPTPPPPPPREETFDEFMARTRRDRERFAKEQEEFFRHMHSRAPFRLLWWRLRDAFQTAVSDLTEIFRSQQ